MTRKQIAAGNWKMNLSYDEAHSLIDALVSANRPDDVVTILGVPHPYLQSAVAKVKGDQKIHISAQNAHEAEKGAYTGEVSIDMLQSIGVGHVILGHSERREYQKESNELLKNKVDAVLEKGLVPIFCCGESLDIRKSGSHVDHVSTQLSDSLFHLSGADFGKIIIAYEPIWAIGTGETASPEQAQDMHAAIRALIAEQYNDDIAQACSILYGGSVKPANAKEIFGQADVDGGLVGGASLKAEDFLSIISSF